MALRLIIDDRERAVISELNTFAADSQVWQTRRLICGDFQIVDDCESAPSNLILAIERKTYSDFARSTQDGRIHRIAAFDSLRNEYPKMKIAVLIEGTRPRSERESINGVPYKTIRMFIHKLIFNYDIHIIETIDVGETAKYLLDLVADISSFRLSSQTLQKIDVIRPDIRVREFIACANAGSYAPICPPAPAPALALAQAQALDSEREARNAQPPPVPTHPAPKIPREYCDSRSIASTTRMRKKSDIDFVRALFCSCDGIGTVISERLIRSGVSFSAFVRGLLPASCHGGLLKLSARYREGRTTDIDIKILRQVGITEQMARELLQFACDIDAATATPPAMAPSQLSIPALCMLSQNQMQTFRFKGRLQKTLMANIYKYLHYGED